MFNSKKKPTSSNTPSDFGIIQARALDELRWGSAVRFSLSKFNDLRDLTIVEVGCGDGYASVYFAKLGAKIIGFDKRSSALKRARNLAQRLKVSERCSFIKCYSEQNSIKSGIADIVFSKSTLQYSKREFAIQEFLRILRPGGTLILIENLPYNPFVNLYRLLRTLRFKNEKEQKYVNSITGYFKFNEIKKLKERLIKVNNNYYNFLSVPTIILNEHFQNTPWLFQMHKIILKIDNFLFKKLIIPRYFAWMIALVAEKPNESLKAQHLL